MSAFEWRDGERWIIFDSDAIDRAPGDLPGRGFERYELLSTERALAGAPRALTDGAMAVELVPPGPVPEAAAALIERVDGRRLVALGGGRVIDSAKAVAAVRGGTVAAIPTTLSGAEMTAIHRLPEGAEAAALIRPALVYAEPDAMTSAPEPRLRASAMNALAHGAEALYTPLRNPVATMAGLRGAELIAAALDAERDRRDRAALAEGALLCGYAIDSAGLSLHHALSQTVVRICRTPHAETNAALLPHTLGAMRARAPEEIAELSAALGTDPERLGARIEQLGGGRRGLGELGARRDRVDEIVDTARGRLAPGWLPDPPGAGELRALLDAAW